MAKTETELQLEEKIKDELDSYYNNAVANKKQTDFYAFITILVNALSALISFGVFQKFIDDPAKIVGIIAIGMAALNAVWTYLRPGDKYLDNIKAYNKLQNIYDDYQFGDGQYSKIDSTEKRNQQLLRDIRGIRNEYGEKLIRDTVDAITNIVNANGK